MPKRKYDLAELKLDYLTWDYESVNSFLIQKWLKTKINWKDVKWWDKDKIKMKEKMLAKATQNVIAKQAKELELPMEQLTIAKKNAVVKVIQKMMGNDLDMSDMERAIKILRTEMWLPTSYNKNENTNYDKIEWIHIVLWWNPIDNSKDDKNNAL